MGLFDVEVQRDLVYSEPGRPELLGDLYSPRTEKPTPAFVLIHGGGFQTGSRDGYRGWATWFASHGYAAMAISYTLASAGSPSYPTNLLDCKAAVRYLRREAPRLRVDPDKIGAMGGSAGAYLAAMVGLTSGRQSPRDTVREPQSDDDVSVVIAFAGLYDLISVWEHDQLTRPPGQHTELHIGGNPMTERARFYEASPLYHASARDASRIKWFIAWGTRDDVVPPAQSETFVTHLSRAGALVRTAPIEGAPHFWYLDRPDGPIDDAGTYMAHVGPRLLTFLDVWCHW
jgi:acetyl esterase/lipase